MLEKTMRVNALYDFYQQLLTSKQQQYMDLYYLNDFSLGEIAEEFHVSRQAVYDNLKRTESMLESFEENLGLYKKYQERLKLLADLKSAVRTHFGESHDILNIIYKLENLD
ncbi:putative DNA-binding protein [Scopulibacillus cellulosilyticus]|uniref:UPF0122 protein ACFQRG_05960 n=1 Tax=Scopulibacillus cellulosilyticus TaxID=2665665 RepID=A0ABW2PW42_9BACL